MVLNIPRRAVKVNPIAIIDFIFTYTHTHAHTHTHTQEREREGEYHEVARFYGEFSPWTDLCCWSSTVPLVSLYDKKSFNLQTRLN